MNWNDRFKWHKVEQLPYWVKKDFGWYCPTGLEIPCPKHGLHGYQHPKYLRGRHYEYKIISKVELNNKFESVSRRALKNSDLWQNLMKINRIRKIKWYIQRKFIVKKWVNTNGDIPDWVNRKIQEIQNDNNNEDFFFDNKYWIIEGRYSIYRITFLSRTEYTDILRKRKVKGILADRQYTEPKDIPRIDTSGRRIAVDDLLKASNYIKEI
jgi:hypothetical protein